MQETGGDWTGTENRAMGREVDWELRRGGIREERMTGKSALQATGEVGEGGYGCWHWGGDQHVKEPEGLEGP